MASEDILQKYILEIKVRKGAYFRRLFLVISSSRLFFDVGANQVGKKLSLEVVFNKVLNMKIYL